MRRGFSGAPPASRLDALTRPLPRPRADLAPLYRHEVVMGMESQPNLDPALPPSGLCNAVILAKPYSSFIGASDGREACGTDQSCVL